MSLFYPYGYSGKRKRVAQLAYYRYRIIICGFNQLISTWKLLQQYLEDSYEIDPYRSQLIEDQWRKLLETNRDYLHSKASDEGLAQGEQNKQ